MAYAALLNSGHNSEDADSKRNKLCTHPPLLIKTEAGVVWIQREDGPNLVGGRRGCLHQAHARQGNVEEESLRLQRTRAVTNVLYVSAVFWSDISNS